MHFQPRVQLAALAVAATTVGALPLNVGAGEGVDINAAGGNIQETGGASLTINKRVYVPPGSAHTGEPETLPNGVPLQILPAVGKRTATTTGDEIKATIGPITSDLKIGPNGEITGTLDTPVGDASGSVQLRRAIENGANGGVIIGGEANGGVRIPPVPLKRDGISGGVDVNSGLGDIEGRLGINKRAAPGVGGSVSVDTPFLDADGNLHLGRRADVNAGGSIHTPIVSGGADGELHILPIAERSEPLVSGSAGIDTPIIDANGKIQLPKRSEPLVSGSADIDTPIIDANGKIQLPKRSEPLVSGSADINSAIVDAEGNLHVGKRSEPIVSGSADLDSIVDANGNVHIGKRVTIGGSAGGSVDTPIVDGNAGGNFHLPILPERDIIDGGVDVNSPLASLQGTVGV